MSGSAALEYGFPSTHSTNAVSVAVYSIALLTRASDAYATTKMILIPLLYCYAFSIVLGRVYCGMHGFYDVVIGSALGAGLAAIELAYGQAFGVWICSDTHLHVLYVVLVVLVLVRVHPEPADDCPCFDDSVCFAAVYIGVELGVWHFATTDYSWNDPVPATAKYSLEQIGWLKTCLRTMLGVVIVFAWRGVAKPLLLRYLPPLYRVFENIGVNLPRRYFRNASSYKTIPAKHKDDNIIPPALDIPSIISDTLLNPRRRAVSIGPQSEADAYETLAYRSQKRRQSQSRKDRSILETSTPRATPTSSSPIDYFDSPPRPQRAFTGDARSVPGAGLLPTPEASRISSYEQMMGTGNVALFTPLTPPPSDRSSSRNSENGYTSEDRAEDKENREMFQRLERPRVRYDVEVVTKLVVYTGIAWLAVEGNPILF
ncbi:hypothetical protein LTS18_004436, partial [Coniosporium uncinatum]